MWEGWQGPELEQCSGHVTAVNTIPPDKAKSARVGDEHLLSLELFREFLSGRLTRKEIRQELSKGKLTFSGECRASL